MDLGHDVLSADGIAWLHLVLRAVDGRYETAFDALQLVTWGVWELLAEGNHGLLFAAAFGSCVYYYYY